MNNPINFLRYPIFGMCLIGTIAITAQTSNPDLPPLRPETLGIVKTLPAKYPSHWILAHDATFFHMIEGRMLVLDPLAETLAQQYKGFFNIFFMGNFTQAKTRPEMYATETFYSRGSRGTRTDVLSIIDKSSLKTIDEIVLPGAKRFTGMPERYAIQLIDNERLLLVFNLNPATSVTVIDIVNRKILNEVGIPGCSLIYPTGARGFSSICSNGGLLTTELDTNGQIVSQQRLDPFFSSDTSPIFERPAIIDGTAYFPGFHSEVHPIDVSGKVAVPGKPWSLVTEKERQEGWRPGGIGLIDSDASGQFYLLMHPNGKEGSQGSGGSEVWVFKASEKKRVNRFTLKNWGLSLGVTKGDDPILVVTNGDLNIDVYKAKNGEYIRTISDFGQETPLMLFGAQ